MSPSWERYIANLEDSADLACNTTALKNGHTKEEAEMCDNNSVGCIDCPFKEADSVNSLKRNESKLHKILTEDWKSSLAKARVERESVDSIESYPDDTIKDWLDEFNSQDSESLFIKDCPFGFYEVRREYIRRDFLKGIKEDLDEQVH